jgi:hypothetical protein
VNDPPLRPPPQTHTYTQMTGPSQTIVGCPCCAAHAVVVDSCYQAEAHCGTCVCILTMMALLLARWLLARHSLTLARPCHLMCCAPQAWHEAAADGVCGKRGPSTQVSGCNSGLWGQLHPSVLSCLHACSLYCCCAACTNAPMSRWKLVFCMHTGNRHLRTWLAWI